MNSISKSDIDKSFGKILKDFRIKKRIYARNYGRKTWNLFKIYI